MEIVTLLLLSMQTERDEVHVAQEEQVGSYLELQHQLAAAKAGMRAVVNQPRHILPFLQPGRLVNIAAQPSGRLRRLSHVVLQLHQRCFGGAQSINGSCVTASLRCSSFHA